MDPQHDSLDDAPKPVDLPRFLLNLLEGNIATSEALSTLTTNMMNLADKVMRICWLLLAALGFFLLGQFTGLIAELVRVGIIG